MAGPARPYCDERGLSHLKRIEVKKLLGFSLDPEYRDRVEQELARNLFHIGKYTCVLILFFQVAMMLVMGLQEGGPFAAPRRAIYFTLYILLFCVTLAAVLAGIYWNQKGIRPSVMFHLSGAYSLLICLWSCAITWNDQFGGSGLNVYTYILLFVAALAVLKPWQSVSIFLTSYAVLNLTLLFTPDGTPQLLNNLANSAFIAVLAIFLSIYLYRTRIQQIYNQIVIERQYGQIREINGRLEELVMTDDLTGMRNRRYLERTVAGRLHEIAEEGRPIAAMMIDIDFFKQYNDTYGHQRGDACLQRIARILLDYVGDVVYAVRYGGEEFFLCLFGMNQDQAIATAERIRVEVEQHDLTCCELPAGHVTVSVGLYWTQPDTTTTLNQLVRRSDEALYIAKREGRNRVSIYPEDI